MKRSRLAVAPTAVIANCLVVSCLALVPPRQAFHSTTQRYARKYLAESEGTTRRETIDRRSEEITQLVSTEEKSVKLVSTEQEAVKKNAVSSFTLAKNPLLGAEQVKQIISHPWVEVTSSFLVLLSSILAAVDTLSLSQYWELTIESMENVIAYTFVLEFMARWYCSSRGFWGYLRKPLVLIDVVVVILPLVLPIIPGMPSWSTSDSLLINLRLLRILRVQRVLQDMGTFTKFTAALGLPGLEEVQPYQLQLARVVLSIFTLLSVNAGLIYAAEHGINPDIQNYFSALYFGLTTLTTVGFGDITPVTWQGKLVVGGSILAGVTIIPAQAALLVEALLGAQNEKEQTSRHKPHLGKTSANDLLPSAAIDANTPCPSCGARFHWNSANYCWSCGGKL